MDCREAMERVEDVLDERADDAARSGRSMLRIWPSASSAQCPLASRNGF